MRLYCLPCQKETEHTAAGGCVLCSAKRDSEKLKEQIAARVREKKVRKKAAADKKRRTYHRHWARREAKERKKERAAAEKAMTQAEIDAAFEASERQRKMSAEERARQEMARREMARRHLLPYIQRMNKGYKAGWMHKLLCLELEQFLRDVMLGKEPRKMIFMPPRHGKSLTASQCFPSWAMGKFPGLEFMCASYAESLQLSMSKQVQQQIRSHEYQVLFPGIVIPRKHEAVSDWQLAKLDEHGEERLTGGGMLAAGVGGPLTGRGFHIGVIDDPVKNRAEADSAQIREATKSWYSSTFYTRAAPGAGILIIQTRWHDDDLSGWLLSQMAEAIKEEAESGHWPEDADRWVVTSFPALAVADEKYRKKDEPLHPERYSLMSLLKKKRSMAPRDWSALYQQNPVAEDGNYFTKQMIRFYSPGDMPPLWKMNIFAAADLAISKKEEADYSVILVAGIDADDNVWILDARRGRWDTDEITDQIINVQRTWNPVRFGIERDKVKIAIESDLNRKIREERLYELVIEDLQIGGRDKRARARPAQGRAAQGKVLWPRGAVWVDDAINELLRFDAGVNDDYVDALAWLCQMLANETYVDRTPAKKRQKSWREKAKKFIKSGRTSKPMGA